MSHTSDITIIGAGVIGLAIASQVTRKSREVCVLEKNETFGREQSSHNSEAIHAGIYYKKDSLKAKMCLEGNGLLYELCEKNGIAYMQHLRDNYPYFYSLAIRTNPLDPNASPEVR